MISETHFSIQGLNSPYFKRGDQGLINRWAKWAIAQGGKLLGAANFHSTCRNK